VPALQGPQATYTADLVIDARARTLSGDLRIDYRNHTGAAQQTIVLNIDANRTAGLFNLTAISANPPLSSHNLTGPRLEVQLLAPLEAGCPITFSLQFTLRVPPFSEARMKYFSYTALQTNVGYFLPEIAPYIDGGWRTPKAWSMGEYTYSLWADFAVKASLINKPSAKTEIIGPGTANRAGDTWDFDFKGGRSFTLVISDAMNILSTTTSSGLLIDLYTFPHKLSDAEGKPVDAPLHALVVAREAAERYTALFGPMPYNRLVIVEGDFYDGMEFSGLVYVGTEWFRRFRGNFDSWLTLITAHEVSHQWWYAYISNDQGTSPYLDEALALYCELLYLEQRAPELAGWWWGFRVTLHQAKGAVDSPVYEYWDSRPYINAVYLRGATMLQEIRERIGEEGFFAWLSQYLAKNKRKIATAADFWGAMTSSQYTATTDIRLNYLRNYDPLNPDFPTPTPIR
jgi:hypothetical protein